jgi:putative acetyltransferase
MLIRTEAPADILSIDSLLKASYPTHAEAELVMSLRENGRFTLSLVACSDEGQVIGYALFTAVTIGGEELNWQALEPIAVLPEARGEHIGQQLIAEGLETLAELGYPVCVVVGDDAYYKQSGFVAADAFNLSCNRHAATSEFQINELLPNSVILQQGEVSYSPEFDTE